MSTSLIPHVSLRPAVPENASSLARIILSNRTPLGEVLYPDGVTPSLLESTEAEYRDAIIGGVNTMIVVAVGKDSEEGLEQVVGFAKWQVVKDVQIVSKEKTKESQNDVQGVGTDANALQELKKKLKAGRDKHITGKGHMLLSQLFVDPAVHGQGIGSSLLAHGLLIADENNLFTYLEASPAGLSLYKRFGFKEVDSFDMDLSKYKDGASSKYTTVLMIRHAHAEGEQYLE